MYVEEIAASAEVSKPVVYEHFGGKEGLYAVVVDREMQHLLGWCSDSLTADRPRDAARAGGVRAARLHRGVHGRLPDPRARPPVARTPATSPRSSATSPRQVEALLADEFEAPASTRKFAADVRPDARRHGRADRPVVARRAQAEKDEVAAHLVNLAWNGLVGPGEKARPTRTRRQVATTRTGRCGPAPVLTGRRDSRMSMSSILRHAHDPDPRRAPRTRSTAWCPPGRASDPTSTCARSRCSAG